VTAVAAFAGGVPLGLAASSFTSVSLDPPFVSVCIARSSRTWPRLREIPRLGISVLGAHQEDASRRLAAPGDDRRILDLLAERGTATVGELAAQFPDLVVSGISKHLMALRAAGLVTATRQGRQQLYRLDADAFADALAPWLAKYEPYWSAALQRLGQLAERSARPATGASDAG
jgi:DNA-binding transcriptional ArsR family regulator